MLLALYRGLRGLVAAFAARTALRAVLCLVRTICSARLPSLRQFGQSTLRDSTGAKIAKAIGLTTFLVALVLKVGAERQPNVDSTVSGADRATQRTNDLKRRAVRAALAGGVGGLGLAWQMGHSQSEISLQLMSMAAQGFYKTHIGWTVPHADILLFSVCCAQIMSAWQMTPAHLRDGYRTWIDSALQWKGRTMSAQRAAIHTGLELAQLRQADLSVMSPGNKGRMVRLAQRLAQSSALNHPPPRAIPCAMLHPAHDRCVTSLVHFFRQAWVRAVPMYATIHAMPALVSGALRERPLTVISIMLGRIAQSCVFLAAVTTLYRSLVCLRTHMVHGQPPLPLKPIFEHRGIFAVFGAALGVSLLTEGKKRRMALALYVLPRAVESACLTLGLNLPGAHYILHAAALGSLMETYVRDQDALPGLARHLIAYFINPE